MICWRLKIVGDGQGLGLKSIEMLPVDWVKADRISKLFFFFFCSYDGQEKENHHSGKGIKSRGTTHHHHGRPELPRQRCCCWSIVRAAQWSATAAGM